MSEYDGLLRVATTRTTSPRPEPEPVVDEPVAPAAEVLAAPPATDGVVTVLEERNGTLDAVGSVGGLGSDEHIRAVRWFGDLAVVVTFRQTDPLYTVDLSDPAAPRVRGELKIPGYSAYLHPVGGGVVLGVGQDATDQGQVTGAQVSSFDLRDLDEPRRVDTADLGRHTWAQVEGDSRAFTFLPDRRTAVLPVSGSGGGGGGTLVALQVGPDGSLTETGRWDGQGDLPPLRALPVDGEQLAVVSDDAVVLLSSDGLRPLGEARL